MPPPPIHWYTKPNLNQQRTQSNQQSTSLQPSQQSADELIPVYIHRDRLPDIEAALRHLGLPPLLNPRGDHGPATAASHEENPSLTHPVPPQFQQRNNPQPVMGHDSNEDDLDYSDLTSSFSQLSTSARHVPQPVVQPDTSPRKQLKKYYVVTVGKCTGVFWDEWDNVVPLIKRVSGARYNAFSTQNQATSFYLHAKENGLVRVVRDPGDDVVFGPLRNAMQ